MDWLSAHLATAPLNASSPQLQGTRDSIRTWLYIEDVVMKFIMLRKSANRALKVFANEATRKEHTISRREEQLSVEMLRPQDGVRTAGVVVGGVSNRRHVRSVARGDAHVVQVGYGIREHLVIQGTATWQQAGSHICIAQRLATVHPCRS